MVAAAAQSSVRATPAGGWPESAGQGQSTENKLAAWIPPEPIPFLGER